MSLNINVLGFKKLLQVLSELKEATIAECLFGKHLLSLCLLPLNMVLHLNTLLKQNL